MNRRELFGTVASGLVASAFSSRALAKPRLRRPNFVVVLCDDLGYGDVEPFGGSIPTPAINRMAREGIVATDYYAPANICSPSRAGLLTGRYPVRTGLGYEVILVGDDRVLPPSEKTIAATLKPDYATGLFGKWHLGHTGTDWLPTNYGFDRFFGIPYSHDMKPLALYDADAASGKVATEPVDYPSLQQRFYAQAERFIEDNRDRPFFVELALSAPHLPEHPSPPFKGGSGQGAYGDVVREIDSIVGRLLDKLKALGLDQDTWVVFTSDNGPWYEGSTGRLRDRKGGAGYDGGYRVPFIAWAPGRIAPHGKANAIISGIDLLPTFCALAGVRTPEGVDLDGKDISKVLTAGAVSPHDQILLFNNEDVAAVRTQRWKFVDQTYYRSIRVNLGASGEMDELYDVQQDPTESYSVAATYPEVVRDMKARLQAAKQAYAPYRKGTPPFFKKFQQELMRRQD